LREFLQISFVFSLTVQINEEDASVETDKFGRYRKAERRSSENIESNKDMHTEFLIKDFTLLNYFLP
jgi:hypothetical protein